METTLPLCMRLAVRIGGAHFQELICPPRAQVSFGFGAVQLHYDGKGDGQKEQS